MDQLRDIKIMFLIAVTALAGTITIDAAYAATAEYPTPLQQQRDGVSIDAIQCNAPRDLYIRDSQTPVCISASTYGSLLERGVELVLHESFARTIYMITDAGVPEIQRVVEEAIRMYDADKENAFAKITSLAGNPVAHYPFVLNGDLDEVLAHGLLPERVGTAASIISQYSDTPHDILIEDLQNTGGVWVDYIFLDPETNEDGLKRSWIVMHDGHVFGAGYYYSIEDKMNRILDDAIALYEEGGFDAINAMITKPTVNYPFAVEPYTGEVMAIPLRPDLVGAISSGSSTSTVDVPFNVIADTMAETGKGAQKYILIVNPITGEPDQKRNFYRLHDGYIFGTGYFYPAADKVVGVVEETIRMYDADKENAFANINAQSENLTPHYPFVIDPASLTIAAHGAYPEERINTPSAILSQTGFTNKTPEEILTELQDGKGVWVEYVYKIPGTEFEEEKHSYLLVHDGYIFGSGYYRSTFTILPQ